MQVERLEELFSKSVELRAEIVRSLSERSTREAGRILVQIAQSFDYAIDVRADAVAGLARHRPAIDSVLQKIATCEVPVLVDEARRSLARRQRSPSADKLDLKNLQSGDAAAGRRVFYRAVGGRCSTCHVYAGRGSEVGPDLSLIRHRGDARWLLETILDPNRDVAPKYANVTIETIDGRTITGLPLVGPGGDGLEVLVQAGGSRVTVPLAQIDRRHSSTGSMMPSGLAQLLSDEELADLIAFLMSPR